MLPYSPLCQGLLTGRIRTTADIEASRASRTRNQRAQPLALSRSSKILDALQEIGARNGKTIAQTALRWVLDTGGVTAAIVGASSIEQLEENIGALGWALAPADWARLAEASWPLSADLEPHDTLWNWHSKREPR